MRTRRTGAPAELAMGLAGGFVALVERLGGHGARILFDGATAPALLTQTLERLGGKADIGVPRVALATLDSPAGPADALPPELAALPAVKPGSRSLAG